MRQSGGRPRNPPRLNAPQHADSHGRLPIAGGRTRPGFGRSQWPVVTRERGRAGSPRAKGWPSRVRRGPSTWPLKALARIGQHCRPRRASRDWLAHKPRSRWNFTRSNTLKREFAHDRTTRTAATDGQDEAHGTDMAHGNEQRNHRVSVRSKQIEFFHGFQLGTFKLVTIANCGPSSTDSLAASTRAACMARSTGDWA